MRLWCEPDVLDDDASGRALDGLLHWVGRQWHVLVVDLEAVRRSRWYRGLGPRDQELVDISAAQWAWHQRRQVVARLGHGRLRAGG